MREGSIGILIISLQRKKRPALKRRGSNKPSHDTIRNFYYDIINAQNILKICVCVRVNTCVLYGDVIEKTTDLITAWGGMK